MKKRIAIIFMIVAALFCLAFGLTACGNTGGTAGGGDADSGVAVTFDAGAGAFPDGTSKKSVDPVGGKVNFTSVPLRDGYAFDGWYSAGVAFDPTETYTSSISFVAKWANGGDKAVYTALFDTDSTVTIDIDMSDAQWKKLNRDFLDYDDSGNGTKTDIYRMADNVRIGITNGGKTLTYYYEEVGVRLKGNTSRGEFYDNNGFNNAVHYKLSFKQTFDDVKKGYKPSELKTWTDDDARKARKKRTFGGMEKIDIKSNAMHDETYVREAYAMKLFNDNGIVAPQRTLCAFTAREKDGAFKNMGVYAVHECVDEDFIERHMPDQTDPGDLYKCTWAQGRGANYTEAYKDGDTAKPLFGIENSRAGEFYVYDLKNNSKNNDFSSVKNFIAALNDPMSVLADHIDLDYFAKFEAVNYLLGSPDCIRNHYNNHYLYFRNDGKAIFIPYDYDRCLGVTYKWDPTGAAMTNVTPYTEETTGDDLPDQENPLYLRTILRGAPDTATQAKFRNNIESIASSAGYSEAEFNAFKNKYKARYAAYTVGAIAQNSVKFDEPERDIFGKLNLTPGEYMRVKLEVFAANRDRTGAGDVQLKPLGMPVVNMTGDGFARWDAVAGATGYEYKINGGATVTLGANERAAELNEGDVIAVRAISPGKLAGAWVTVKCTAKGSDQPSPPPQQHEYVMFIKGEYITGWQNVVTPYTELCWDEAAQGMKLSIFLMQDEQFMFVVTDYGVECDRLTFDALDGVTAGDSETVYFERRGGYGNIAVKQSGDYTFVVRDGVIYMMSFNAAELTEYDVYLNGSYGSNYWDIDKDPASHMFTSLGSGRYVMTGVELSAGDEIKVCLLSAGSHFSVSHLVWLGYDYMLPNASMSLSDDVNRNIRVDEGYGVLYDIEFDAYTMTITLTQNLTA